MLKTQVSHTNRITVNQREITTCVNTCAKAVTRYFIWLPVFQEQVQAREPGLEYYFEKPVV